MQIEISRSYCNGLKISAIRDNKEVGRAFLYIMFNDLHNKPFGFVEDVYVQEEYRGQKIGMQLVKEILKKAKEYKCYKIIATSRYTRPKIHEWYAKLGFDDYGKEFRINLREK